MRPRSAPSPLAIHVANVTPRRSPWRSRARLWPWLAGVFVAGIAIGLINGGG